MYVWVHVCVYVTCVYVFGFVYACACVWFVVCMCVCVYACVYVCMDVCPSICVSIYICICMVLLVCACMYVCMCVCMRGHRYMGCPCVSLCIADPCVITPLRLSVYPHLCICLHICRIVRLPQCVPSWVVERVYAWPPVCRSDPYGCMRVLLYLPMCVCPWVTPMYACITVCMAGWVFACVPGCNQACMCACVDVSLCICPPVCM